MYMAKQKSTLLDYMIDGIIYAKLPYHIRALFNPKILSPSFLFFRKVAQRALANLL